MFYSVVLFVECIKCKMSGTVFMTIQYFKMFLHKSALLFALLTVMYLTFAFRDGLYLGWCPVVTALCCSNFVYFYTYNGLKSAILKGRKRASPLVDLSVAFVSGTVEGFRHL